MLSYSGEAWSLLGWPSEKGGRKGSFDCSSVVTKCTRGRRLIDCGDRWEVASFWDSVGARRSGSGSGDYERLRCCKLKAGRKKKARRPPKPV